MVHCSGGAQTKVLHFVENLHIIKDHLFPIPPLFKLIQEQSNTDWKEMFKVLNCGTRMEMYVEEQYAQQVIAIAKSFGVHADVIGYTEAHQGVEVKVQSAFGEFLYS